MDKIRLSQALPTLREQGYDLPPSATVRAARDMITRGAVPARLSGQVWFLEPDALPVLADALGCLKKAAV